MCLYKEMRNSRDRLDKHNTNEVNGQINSLRTQSRVNDRAQNSNWSRERLLNNEAPQPLMQHTQERARKCG